jgi:hypothetical protein
MAFSRFFRGRHRCKLARSALTRLAKMESLEPRQLLAGDSGFLGSLPTAQEARFGALAMTSEGREVCLAFKAETQAEGEAVGTLGFSAASAATDVDISAAISAQPAGPLLPLDAFSSTISFANAGPGTADNTGLAVTFDDSLAGVTWERETIRSQAATVAVSGLDGTNGFMIDGVAAFDTSGFSVSGAGDLNDDGIDDLVVGATGGNASLAGEVYVVFGTTAGFPQNLDLGALDRTDGFTVVGAATDDGLGASVAAAGDINDDGVDDLIIGAPGHDAGGNADAGQAYVIFGGGSGFASQLNVSTLDGTNGFAISGINVRDGLGTSVSSAGDLNDDGIADVIVGAPFVSRARPGSDPPLIDRFGEAYVVFGSDSAFDANIDPAALTGVNGFRIETNQVGDVLGADVSRVGDFNGDLIDDVVVGAPQTERGGSELGAAYVVFGKTTFSSAFDVGSLDGTNGVAVTGVRAGHALGSSVGDAGDFNADGRGDLILGEVSSPNNESANSYVVFGSSNAFSATFGLGSIDGSNGLVIEAPVADHPSDMEVSGAKDVNGDGIDDVVIGLPETQVDATVVPGGAYVVYGNDGDIASPLNLATLDGTNGFLIEGMNPLEQAGESVAVAGDVNGDGFADVILGAPFATVGTEIVAGQSYVVFGKGSTFGSGAGPISDTVDLGPGDQVVYTVSATIAADASDSTVVDAVATVDSSLTDLAPGNNAATATTLIATPPEVVARHLFYNNSAYDGTSGASESDDQAIDTSKSPLLPNETASFSNYTGFDEGINGVMIDIANLQSQPAAADFQFTTGNDDNPDLWTSIGVMPSVSVRWGQGTENSDRVTLIWPDDTIADTWLEITVLSDGPNQVVSTPDVFYFGSALGEVGAGDSRVNSTDAGGVGANFTAIFPPTTELVTNPYDVNKDGRVNSTDFGFVGSHFTPIFPPGQGLSLITPAASNGSNALVVSQTASGEQLVSSNRMSKLSSARLLASRTESNPDSNSKAPLNFDKDEASRSDSEHAVDLLFNGYDSDYFLLDTTGMS